VDHVDVYRLEQVGFVRSAWGTTEAGRPANLGFVHRGVAYWSAGTDTRILIGTGDGSLIALNAKTGEPIPTFGTHGRIDLTEGLGRPVERRLYSVTSPPIVVRDVVSGPS